MNGLVRSLTAEPAEVPGLPEKIAHLAAMTLDSRRDPLEQQALLVMALLDRLGVMDPDAPGATAETRALAALVLAGFDRLLARQALGADPVTEHVPSREEQYAALAARVRHLLHVHVPDDAHVAVVSRGDRALTEVDGRTTSHFPQDERGGWAGHYPADGHGAVEHLDELRRRGVSHLAIPATGRWWLNHYVELRLHLEAVGRPVFDDEDLVVFQLQPIVDTMPITAPVCTPLAALLPAMLPRDASVVIATNDPSVVVAEPLVAHQWTACSGHDDDGIVTASVVQAATHRPDHGVVVVLVHTGTWWSASHPRLWADLQRAHHLLADRPGIATVFELVPPGAEERRAAAHGPTGAHPTAHVAHLAHLTETAHLDTHHTSTAPAAAGGSPR